MLPPPWPPSQLNLPIVLLFLSTITSPGAYSLIVAVNPSKTIAELNYVNNYATMAVVLAKNAPLQINTAAIRVETGSVRFAVANIGKDVLDSGTLSVSVGFTSLGNVTNLRPQYPFFSFFSFSFLFSFFSLIVIICFVLFCLCFNNKKIL